MDPRCTATHEPAKIQGSSVDHCARYRFNSHPMISRWKLAARAECSLPGSCVEGRKWTVSMLMWNFDPILLNVSRAIRSQLSIKPISLAMEST